MKKPRFCLSVVKAVLGFVLLGAAACGSGAPPVSIQAPVSNLMTVSEPDPQGVVTITGSAGAVEANATVIASDPPSGNTGGRRWSFPWIQSAWAQVTASTTADATGAFSLQITAAACDSIGVRQVVGGVSSPETVVTVPGPACSCPATPVPPGTVPFGGACDEAADCADGLPCVSCQCV